MLVSTMFSVCRKERRILLLACLVGLEDLLFSIYRKERRILLLAFSVGLKDLSLIP